MLPVELLNLVRVP